MSLAEQPIRERCYRCWRPASLCFCDAIPHIDNRTPVLLLQHVAEQSHAFNTARVVYRALGGCQLVVDSTQGFCSRSDLPIHERAALLYPSDGSCLLEELPKDAGLEQLIIIDGTWHQAKTIVRDVAALRGLPCYRLAPSEPGQYRIRQEPNDETLSTLEATVAALGVLEPETPGLDQLLRAFHRMVGQQLERLGGPSEWRRKARRDNRPRFIPRTLLGDARRIVVAYGESQARTNGRAPATPTPVNWHAQRLSSNESFTRLLKQDTPPTDAALNHMRLSMDDFQRAVTPEAFRKAWRSFLRPDDILVVYHYRTCQLLKNIQAEQPRCLVLKSIFRNWEDRFPTLEELADAEGIELNQVDFACRAALRLQLAVQLVEHLRANGSHAVPQGR